MVGRRKGGLEEKGGGVKGEMSRGGGCWEVEYGGEVGVSEKESGKE